MLIWIYGDYIFISNLYFPRSHHLHARWVLYLAVLTILQLQELSVCCQRGTASPGTDYKTLIQRLPVDRRVKSLTLFQIQTLHFPLPIFRPCLYNITSLLLGLQRQQQILLKNYFQSAYFSFFPLICDWIQYKVRSKWANLYPFRD